MNSSIRNRLLTILFVFGLGIYALLPSIRYAMMDDDSISNLSSEQKDYFESRSLKQGLDLKGGIYIVLEVLSQVKFFLFFLLFLSKQFRQTQ